MRVVPFLARPFLATMFVTGGADAVRSPAGRSPAAAKLGLPQPELMVRANGAAMAVAGTSMALGIKPRLSALTLLASLAPTTYASHAFWELEDPAQRQAQQVQFWKNVGLAGGLLMVAGEPSRGSRRAGRRLERRRPERRRAGRRRAGRRARRLAAASAALGARHS